MRHYKDNVYYQISVSNDDLTVPDILNEGIAETLSLFHSIVNEEKYWCLPLLSGREAIAFCTNRVWEKAKFLRQIDGSLSICDATNNPPVELDMLRTHLWVYIRLNTFDNLRFDVSNLPN